VDMAVYQLDAPPVVQALNDAIERGVTIRIVTSTEVMEDEDESKDFVELADAGVEVVDGNPNAIMHNKFVVVDGQAVWTGSWNFTAHDTYRYNNHGILIRSPELAANYTAVFEKMWNDGLFGRQREPGGTTPTLTIQGATVENYFAPEDATTEAIIARLEQAQESIHFMAFSFTDDQMGDVILARAEEGVEVHGVFENTGSNTEFSEFGRMSEAGLDVIQDGNPYLMHHKVFIIDSRTVVLGSFNFSANARDKNDENLLIIDDPALAQQFIAEFQRVYAQAQNPPNR
jgi:phosphatidylserine/phosphatidylglycerophosphate/cardiolipin synthase-like enzyme